MGLLAPDDICSPPPQTKYLQSDLADELSGARDRDAEVEASGSNAARSDNLVTRAGVCGSDVFRARYEAEGERQR